LAPIREFNSASARRERGGAVGSEQDWTGAIEGGIRTVLAAHAYLAGHAAVDKSKIGVIGFSEGGNVTLWSVLENNDFAAVVLMSPATLRSAGKYALRSAGRDRRMGNLKMPVLLTVGADDYPQIKRIAGRMLARRLGRSSADFKYRADYPGTHNWFHRVRAAHWADVTRFFHRHLD
jgi:dienelactone hydrolase